MNLLSFSFIALFSHPFTKVLVDSEFEGVVVVVDLHVERVGKMQRDFLLL